MITKTDDTSDIYSEEELQEHAEACVNTALDMMLANVQLNIASTSNAVLIPLVHLAGLIEDSEATTEEKTRMQELLVDAATKLGSLTRHYKEQGIIMVAEREAKNETLH